MAVTLCCWPLTGGGWDGTRVVLFAEIREDHRLGLRVRAIARKYGVHRRTVREALASPVPVRASPAALANPEGHNPPSLVSTAQHGSQWRPSASPPLSFQDTPQNEPYLRARVLTFDHAR